MAIARNDVVPRADLDLLHSWGFKQCTRVQTEFHNRANPYNEGEKLRYLVYEPVPLGRWVWVRWVSTTDGSSYDPSPRFADLRACYAHAELTNWGET